MNKSRMVLHPVLLHPRSRILFIYFFFLTAFVGLFMGYEFRQIVSKSGIDLTYGSPSHGWLVSMFVSVYFQVAMVLLAALLSSALTAQFVVGPVKRIEQWLQDWQSGKKLPPLKVRNKDKFAKLVDLINLFHEKLSS